VTDHREIVGDEEVGKAELLLEYFHRVQHLRLDRNVQRRDGFVADDEIGIDRQRSREIDALALPAGERVGKPVVVARIEPHLLEEVLRPRFSPSSSNMSWALIGSSMIWPTFIRGSSEDWGSWKIICISERVRRRSSPPRSARFSP